MSLRWVWIAFIAMIAVGLNSCSTATNPSSNSTSFLWVATVGDQMVRSYSVDLTRGTVAQTGDAIATGVQPQAMAITPDGQNLFIANSGDNTISAYSVNSDGTLKSAGTTPSPGALPIALAMDPTGKILFAAEENSGDIAVFTVSSTSLTLVGAFPTQTVASPVISNPTAIAVSPTGNFLYVTNSATNWVLGYSFDSTGALTPLPSVNPNPCGLGAPGYCVPVGTNPSGLAFSRCAGVTQATATCATADGNNLFVANSGSNNIRIFSACIQSSALCSTADGTLTELSKGSPVSAGSGPTTILIDPAANFVYAVDRGSSEISPYTYSPVTGALTVSPEAPLNTGASPFAGAITANTNNTNWIFTSNNGASSLSQFSVVAGGRLSPVSTGPISLAGQPAAILAR